MSNEFSSWEFAKGNLRQAGNHLEGAARNLKWAWGHLCNHIYYITAFRTKLWIRKLGQGSE